MEITETFDERMFTIKISETELQNLQEIVAHYTGCEVHTPNVDFIYNTITNALKG